VISKTDDKKDKNAFFSNNTSEIDGNINGSVNGMLVFYLLLAETL
jgi:hypothetical protein